MRIPSIQCCKKVTLKSYKKLVFGFEWYSYTLCRTYHNIVTWCLETRILETKKCHNGVQCYAPIPSYDIYAQQSRNCWERCFPVGPQHSLITEKLWANRAVPVIRAWNLAVCLWWQYKQPRVVQQITKTWYTLVNCIIICKLDDSLSRKSTYHFEPCVYSLSCDSMSIKRSIWTYWFITKIYYLFIFAFILHALWKCWAMLQLNLSDSQNDDKVLQI
jgi:hypothetical protein